MHPSAGHIQPAGQATNPRSESDVHFRSLMEILPAAAYTCDAAGLITYFNEQAVELWGRAPQLNDSVDRFCGSFKLFLPDGSPVVHEQCWMAEALRTGREQRHAEIVIERPSGDRKQVLANAKPILDEAGRIVGAVNVLVDITDRKRAEEAQTLLAAIVESSEDAILSKTLEGHLLSWNAGAERLFGYSAQEVIGRPVTLIVPVERHHEERTILSRLSRGERIEHYETERVARDRRRIDVSLTVSPVRDSTGRIIGASSVVRDITARKQGEAAVLALRDELATQLADMRRLHDMSTRLATTLELQPILDETLRTAAAIGGTGMGILSICDPEDGGIEVGASIGFDDDFLEIAGHVESGSAACGTAYRDGKRVIVEDVETDAVFEPYRQAARQAGFRAVHSTPLVTRTGKVVGVLSTHFGRPHRPTDRETHLIDLCVRQAVDFIENARLYHELREIDRRKDEFLATLAHELRNPLAPLCNALQLLRMTDDADPAPRPIRDIMERQVNHLVRLVEDLLEVSRISRGKIDLQKAPVELAAIVANAVETSRPVIDAAGHQLAITACAEPLMLEADGLRLSQVISNLLNNAAKYTHPGGQIWVSVRREGDQAVISVRDNGVGIPADSLNRVFEMFTQVDQTRDKARGGLGIGLTLASSLVQLHGGHIEARSDGPGKGSEFIVSLPLMARHPQPKLPIEGPANGERTRSVSVPACRILIVDDTRASAFVLGKLLETMGQQVETACTGESAIAQARAMRPDLVISDIGMPEMDGYELARRLRREPGLEGLVLAALTGYGQDSDREQAKQAGFDYHLVKPVSLEALEELLNKARRVAVAQ